MFRFLGVILLSLCVLAMPSYAALACGTTCADMTAAHEYDCCPTIAAEIDLAGIDDVGAPNSSNHSNSGHHHHCVAPCCAYVAHMLSGAVLSVEAKPLADLLPTAVVAHGSGNHDAIFHPPRI